MPNKPPQQSEPASIATSGRVLGFEGGEISSGLWENGVYLGRDGFVYHITARRGRGRITAKIESKRPVGDYLRWVDGVFHPGELPTESNAVHYRAARKLRELI
jgi:hypothetical protein